MPIDTSGSNMPKLKMHEGRKSSKPLMEKRRRARINDSLGQLKTLILEATNKDSSRHSKLEKADILEMTVKYLRNMQRQQMSAAMSNDPNLLNRYRLGFSECISEVSRFLNNGSEGPNVEVQTNLIGHLANCCSPQGTPAKQQPQQQQQAQSPPQHSQQQQQVSYAQSPITASQNVVQTSIAAAVTQSAQQQPILQQNPAQLQVAVPPASCTQTLPTVAVSAPYQPNTFQGGFKVESNIARVISGIPIGVPGTLPSGEITVVLPSQALPGGQLPSHFIPVYAQSTPLLSPPASSHSSDSSTPSPMSSPNSSMNSPTLMNGQTTIYQPTIIRDSPQTCYVTAPVNSAVLSPAPSPVTHGDARGSASSPVAGNLAPIMVQAPTLVTLPAHTVYHQTPHAPITENGHPQPLLHQIPRKTVLRAVNAVNVPPHHVEHDSMWRPW